jgi:hypothetical protein
MHARGGVAQLGVAGVLFGEPHGQLGERADARVAVEKQAGRRFAGRRLLPEMNEAHGCIYVRRPYRPSIRKRRIRDAIATGSSSGKK